MAVLIEAISVIIRPHAISEKYPGGWSAFEANPPNGTLCADGELVRVGFMTPDDTKRFIEELESFGFQHLAEGKAWDLVVVDQQKGFLSPCDWAEYGHIAWGNDPKKPIAACRAFGSNVKMVAIPDGWTYDNSLTSEFEFVENGHINEELEFLRREGGNEVYRDRRTGKERYVGRVDGRVD